MLALGIASLLLNQSQGDASKTLTYFANSIKDSRSIQGTKSEYGLTQMEFDQLTEQICNRMISPEFDHDPNMSIGKRADSIKSAVLAMIGQHAVNPNSVLVQRMIGQGLYEWIRTHFRYSQYLAKEGVPRDVRKPYWDAGTVLKMPSPYCVCPGYANSMVALGKALGLDVFAVNGFARRWFDSSKLPTDGMKTWHKWVVLRQSDGMLVPFDPTNSSISLEFARGVSPKEASARASAPSSPEDYAIYNAVYFSTIRSDSGKVINSGDQLNSLSYSSWRQIDVSRLRPRYEAFVGTRNWKTCLTD